jgi:hypothetical protein
MITVKVKNKTNHTVNLQSGPLYAFQEGFASQAEASNMFDVLEWIKEPELESEEKKRGRPLKSSNELGISTDGI